MSEEKKPWYEAVKERLTELETDVAYMRGQLDEMKRHNTKIVKVLIVESIIALLVAGATIICALITAGKI